MTPLMFLLLLWAGVTAGSIEKRLVGGETCDKNDWQYHVKVTGSLGIDGFYCGGTLIHTRWVLTSAHCWVEGWTHNVTVILHPRPYPGWNGMEVAVKSRYVYDETVGTPVHDIALLKINQITDVDLQTIALPSHCPYAVSDARPAIPPGQVVQAAGYGSSDGHPFPTLQCADLDVIACRDDDIPDASKHNIMFCGQRDGVDVCHGDSGGGVVYTDPNHRNDGNRIYGVIKGCDGPNTPCSFMDVCHYRDWIKRTMKAHCKTCVIS